jgi:hypothetical protein
MTAREHGASVADAKHLGNWRDGDAYRQAYDRLLPTEALLGAAMFNARRPETHCLARDFLGTFLIHLLNYPHIR